jgi:multidrug efflux pump subunit AcrA (membrane-fusion protein)
MSKLATSAGEAPAVFLPQKMTVRRFVTWRKLSAFGLVLLVVVASAAFAARSPLPTDPLAAAGPDPAPLVVPVATAQWQDAYVRTRTYTGILREGRRSSLAFQRAGLVTEVLVDHGAEVTKGQPLARLDQRHLQSRREELAARRAEAEALLQELLAGPRIETIAAKRAELDSLAAECELIDSQLARRAQLVGGNSVSREEYESFLYQAKAAAARANVARRQLEEMEAGTRPEQLAAQRARVAALDAALEVVDHDLADTQLEAPFDGRIAKRWVDEGAVLTAGTPVVELVEATCGEAWIALPLEAAASLTTDATYALQIDGVAAEATLDSLAPDVDETTRTRMAVFRLRGPHCAAVPGQVVRLDLTEDVTKTGAWVPTTALARGPRGLWSLYVVEPSADAPSRIVRRDVELLDTLGERSYVRGGLLPGDQLVTDGLHRVSVGQAVTPASTTIGG